MTNKFLKTSILLIILFWFIFPINATASRLKLTLGWHNLLMDDLYLIAEDGTAEFSVGDKIKGKQLHRSGIASVATVTDIDITDLGMSHSDYDVLSVNLSRKAKKWLRSKTNKQLRKAAKKERKKDTGKKRGWRRLYRQYKGENLWDLYETNYFVSKALNRLEGMKIKGKIGKEKFVAYLDIFENPVGDESTPFIEEKPSRIKAQVPEPTTILLFSMGLLGISGISRYKKERKKR